MKKSMLLAVLTVALTGCVVAGGKPRPTLSSIKERYDWATSYEKGIQLAREKNKPAIIFFYHSLCLSCRNLVLNIAADQRAADLLDHYVFIGVNISDRKTRKKFGVKGVPDVRYLMPDGTEVEKLTDRAPEKVADQLARVLKHFKQSKTHW